ncbi:heavy metal translocating P-type ATPase [Campylobacter corcagiensis]|uniref:P-type Zn(2+) transporter n=1 Tax=Campylobacter corcagiensis TaxID=1448857 RepID=A0A7M1LFL9_9BACT|nr:heavy metal translocating P-type ATPase [Campylobacter corcagiensis]QKF64425.1 heavy metal translocating P-type ATPase [Campylobacter corcagiensis]QOQ87389.1 cadmium-translocating P-type ATPase [Campylobacter corcagiensis]
MKKDLISIAMAAFLSLLGLLVDNPTLKTVIFIIAWLFVGWEIAINAIKTLRQRSFLDENFLMTIASIGAFIIQEQIEAVAVMLFYRIGEAFEKRSINKSRKSITEAMSIMPEFANLKLADGSTKKVDPDEIKIDDTIVIKPGEKVPLDGIITKGNSTFNTSALTGESLPKELSVGDEIVSGYLNLSSLLEVRVTTLFQDSTVAKILELTEDASSKKSRQEKFITKFARVYTPIVVCFALFLAVVPPLFTGEFKEWIYRALIFLVVSCPCALVVSVPLSFFGGIGGASKRGILIKGSNFLDSLSRVKTVVFDKTGTLTKGEFSVDMVVNEDKFSKDEILEIAALSALHSTHPISVSILKHLNKNLDENRVSELKEIAGLGVKAKIDGKDALVGSSKLLEGLNLPLVNQTCTFVAINGEFAGYITLKDTLRDEAKQSIEALKQDGIKTAMLSGDKKEVAFEIGEILGIDEIRAELLPDKKLENLERLLSQKSAKSTLAYIGDGINDAPVLARADVGISMLGSQAAIEAGDIVLLDNNLDKLIKAIKISKKTIAVSYQNIIFSIGIKVLVLILAIMGLATIWMAIFADVGVTILAILNSLRVYKYANRV